MNCKFNFDLNWYFKPEFDESAIRGDVSQGFVRVNLPHTVRELPYNCFSQELTVMRAAYVKRFTVPEPYADKRAILEFEGVMARHELYVNGKKAGEHSGGYSRCRFDITPYLNREQENIIAVLVDTHEDKDIPPFGSTIDYLTYGGIYRSVNLYFTEQSYVDHVFFRYDLNGTDASLFPEAVLVNHGEAFRGEIRVDLLDAEGRPVKSYSRAAEVRPGENGLVLEPEPWRGAHLWTLDDPYRYTAVVSLLRDGVRTDECRLRTGFRTAECKPDGFYLNGEKIKLVGLDRHQSFPYVGYAMPARVQEKDADILKNYLHVNTVRTSHYMQSEDFLDKCDETGLLVFSEMPGWGYIGGETFKQNALQNIRDMITTEYNHPSIFIWSIRINESDDDDEFYTRANDLAKSLDTSRATTGVRCIKRSHLIEDVYTYNDFLHNTHEYKHYRELVLLNQQTVTGLTHRVPFLVSEYGGHVYPVKPCDGEERQLRHVLLHAAVQSANMQRTDAMGAIGWCAFDYNTHGDYGSGDKVCYHGVMDMFRTPKYAAQLYRSQADPEKEIILEPATVFARGENDDNKPIPFAVLTNCDYIEVVAYNRVIGKFFPSLTYGGLAHPPIIVDEDPGRWQDLWDGGAVIGYYKGKEAARRTYAKDACLNALEVRRDDDALCTTTVDATRFVCRYVDQNGNLLPFYNGVVQIDVKGDLERIGPSVLATLGGKIGFWVKTKPTGRNGTAFVTVKAPGTDIPDQTFPITLYSDDSVSVL